MDEGSKEISSKRIAKDVYRESEVLERGNPLWGLLKHLRAHEAYQAAKETQKDLIVIKQENYIKMQRLLADGELARNHAQVSDAIQGEQLIRRGRLLTDFIGIINQAFSDPSYGNIPDDVKADFINNLCVQAQDMVFNSPNAPDNIRRLSNSPDVGLTIIDTDEF